ncbi:rolling circle replication-associated protein [Sulfurimonas sp.]|uniref:rolling circle replication-associated protein n=1 Tax=Sulfurimonas sp. TaxID=2022749 RepID=UPI003D0DC328
MTNYGLTKYQIQKSKEKLLKNKEFMHQNGIHLDDKIIPFADFVANSYMNADRYIAELQHRAWSVYDYAKEKNLSNAFITLTLPSHWHPKKTYKGRLITNKQFAGRKYITTIKGYKILNCHVKQKFNGLTFEPLLDFSQTVDFYTPRNASIELSNMWKLICNERSYRNIGKEDRVYLRVTEPHKDGTPHLHISLFVPADKVESIVKACNRLFPAPLSKVETNVQSPISYLMKYILKTLDDLREDSDKITNLTLWYLYHGICRFYTSRTFVSLEVYRKLNGMYSLIDLTKAYNSEDVNVYIDTQTKQIKRIDNEHGTIYTRKPVNWANKLDDLSYLESQFETIYKDKEAKQIDVIIDGETFVFFKNTLKKPKTMPYQMNSLQLWDYFEGLDVETCDLKHYAYTKNILIERGLIDEPKVNLSAYQDNFYKFEAEEVF